MNDSITYITGTYDLRLVALSVIVAVMASYAALDLSERVTAAPGNARWPWLTGSAAVLGVGIWSMHFIGMLSFSIPMPLTYDLPTILAAMLIAVIATWVALFIVNREVMGPPLLALGSLFLGGGILGMHYMGMAGMRMQAVIRYDHILVALSAVIAVGASLASLWLACRLRRETATGNKWLPLKIASALFMGGAIAGMHYTGMAATSFRPTEGALDPSYAVKNIEPSILAAALAVTTLAILGSAIFISVLNRRHQTQTAELKESEKLHRSIVETAPNAIVIVDAKGLIQRFNDHAESIFDYTADEVMGQPLKILMPERFREAYEHGLRRYTESGQAQALGKTVELVGLRKSGEEFPAEISLDEITYGEDVSFIGIIRDITERKRIEHEKLKNEKVFRPFFEQSVDALLVHDEEGHILDANSVACRSLGYTREEMLHLRVHDFATNLASIEKSAGDTLWRRILEDEPGTVTGTHHGEHRRKDGTSFPVEVRVGSVDYLGRRAIFASARDITERKEAEQRASTLYTVTKILAETTTLQEATPCILGTFCENLGWEVGELWRLDQEQNVLRCVHIWHVPSVNVPELEAVTRRMTFSPGAGLPGRVWASREPAFVADLADMTGDENFPRAGAAVTDRLRGAFAFPIMHGEEVLGAVMFRTRKVREPNEELLEMASIMGGQIGQFIERVTAEKQLGESEMRFRDLSSATFEGISISEQGVIKDVNTALVSMLGYEHPSEIVGKNALEFIAPESRDVMRESIIRNLEEAYEVVALKKDGSTFDAEIRAKASTYLGRPVRVAAVRDISERKQNEERLRRQAELLNLTQDSVIVRDPDARISFWNSGAEQMYGWTREEALGKSSHELLRTEFPEPLEKIEADLVRDGYWSGEVVNFRRDGEPLQTATRWALRRTEAGESLTVLEISSDITERKRAEQRLRENEELLQDFLDNANDLIQSVSPEGRFLYVNRAWRETLGYTEEEVYNLSILDILHPDAREHCMRAFASVLTGESLPNVEASFVTSDGRKVVVEGSANCRFEDGQPVATRSIFRDVTEKRKAEEDLREAEARFRGAFEDAAVGMALTDPESGRYLRVNRALCEMLGYTVEELLATTFHGLTYPEDLDLSVEYARRAVAGEIDSYQHEKRYLHADGHLVWAQANISLIRDAEGHPLYFVVQMQDVTERKRADEQIRESEERYRLVARATNEVLWDNDIKSGTQRWNGAIQALFGYPVEEVHNEGGWWEERIHPNDRERVLSNLDEVLASDGEMWSSEYRFRRADGEYSTVVDRGYVVRDARGEPVRMLGSMMDVTARRKTEEELKQLTRELENRVGERTAQLQGTLAELEDSLRKNARAITRERTLRNASAALLAALDKEHIFSAALEAALPFIEEAPGTRVSVWSGSGEKDVCVGAAGDEAAELEGKETHIREFPDWIRIPLLEGRTVTLRPLDAAKFRNAFKFNTKIGAIYMTPLYFGGEFRGRIVVASDSPLIEDIKYALETLGSQVAMALERVDLNEDLLKRQTEDRLGSLIRNSSDITIILDENGIINYVSPAIERMLGHEPEDFLGSDGFAFIHPDDVARARSFLSDILGNPGTTSAIELRLRHADGSWRHMESLCNNLLEDPAVGGIVINSRDVTERKQAEEQLREAEARFRLAFDNTAIGMALTNPNDGTYLRVNRAMYEMLGYSEEELLETDSLAVTHPDDREETREKARQLLEGEMDSYLHEKRYLHAAGHIISASVSVSLVKDEEASPLYFVVQMRDITELKRAEEERYEAVERFRGAFDNAAIGMAMNTLDGHFIQVNQSLCRMLGYTEEEMLSLTFKDITDPDDLEISVRQTQRIVEGEIDHYSLEKRYVHTDGHLVWVLLNVSLTKDSRGNPLYFVAQMQDITERKRMENRLATRSAQLETTVRLLERNEEELRNAKEAAEAANRAKSEFLANMSHEIRTPMNGVIGMMELLLDTPLTPEQREFAETVKASGENLLVIISDILDFSKIEAGKMNMETLDFDLRTAVEDVVDLLAEKAHRKQLEIACLIEYNVPTALRGDPGRLRQVLTNLLGNAIKFTEDGEAILRVELVGDSGETAKICFSISDTGIGLTEEQQSKLFQSFSQADASTTRKYGGTGLGLAISKQLVELMGGEIGVRSKPGVGSTFWFAIPMAKQPPESQKGRSAPPDLQNLRVLIVDDNATNRKILHEQLSSWGMRDASAGSGRQALEMMHAATERREPFDLAILDMQMPEMDGIQLAKRIKQDTAISATRLILLTSVGERGDGKEARRAGIEAYLTKPIRQAILLDAMTAVVSGSGSAPEEEPRLVTRHSIRELQATSRARVLLAEDNMVNQKVAVRMLEKMGYRVDVAENGLDALDALAHNSYAAVLMDVQMPEMDGYQATAEIRRRERNKGEDRHVPIIAMTANAFQADRELSLDAGMDDYIAKPVRRETLEATLRRWIPHRTEQSSGQRTPLKGAYPADGGMDTETLAALRDLQGEDEPDMLSELVELFLDDATSRLAALRDLIERGDAQSVKSIAHTLKGSSGNMGARRMSALANDMQEAGASHDLHRAADLLVKLEEEFARVRPALLTFADASTEGD